MKRSAPPRNKLPGKFQPEFPAGNATTFLFHRIAERVAVAGIVRDEELCHVAAVTYEPSPHPGVSFSPLIFRINSATNLISRIEATVTHRHPADDEIHVNRMVLAFTGEVVNQPIPPEIFEYTPPADAVEVSGPGGRAGMGGGGSGGGFGVGRIGPFETRTSHEWSGETLIERSSLRVQSADVAFERRLTVSGDGKELRISERSTGPKGQTEREYSIPLA